MTTIKREFGQQDAQPIVLYAKDDADAREAYPLLRSMFNPGLQIPVHDTVLITYSSSLMSTIHYVASGSTVATLTLSYNADDCLESVVRS
jgi:hypothetical protein